MENKEILEKILKEVQEINLKIRDNRFPEPTDDLLKGCQ